MKIYDWPIAPNSRRVHIYLAEKGSHIPLVEVGEGFVLKQDYRDKFPQAMVPLLELDDGTTIGECMAICRYFEALHPDPPLFGTDPMSSAQITCWENRANEEGIMAVGEVFRNTHPEFADRGLPGSAEKIPQNAALVERGKARVKRFFQKIDGQLSNNQFLAGDSYSAADITGLCAVDFGGWIEMGPEDDFGEQYPNVRRWHKEVSSRPSAKA